MNNYEELSLSDRKINTRAMDNIIEPGYYDRGGNKILTWDEFLCNSGLKVTNENTLTRMTGTKKEWI